MAQVTTIEISSLINQIKAQNSEQVVSEAFGILLKLISNILVNPTDEKFKVIKKTNKVINEKLLRCAGTIDLVHAVGYEDADENVLIFAGEIENLYNLKAEIQAVITSDSQKNSNKSLNSENKSNASSRPVIEANIDDQAKLEIKPSGLTNKEAADLTAHKAEVHKDDHVKPPAKSEDLIKPQHSAPKPIHDKKVQNIPASKASKLEDPKPKDSKIEENQPEGPEPDYKLEWSGSSYTGPIKDGWFEGKGRFRFKSGVVYEGDFHKGEFHGKGILIFPNGGKYKASWDRGRAVDGEYEYYDGLIYDSQNWNYCQIPDRRFYTEIKEGLRPAGATLLVNDPEGPEAMVPGTYDVGNGYYSVNSNEIYSYKGEEMGPPEDADLREILDKYRYNPSNL